MKYRLTAFLALLICTLGIAQVSPQKLDTSGTSISEVLQNAPQLCNLLRQELAHTGFAKNHQITVVHYGSFESLESFENILALNRLQKEHDDVKYVVAIYSENPDDTLRHQTWRELYNIGIPIFLSNRKNLRECLDNNFPVTMVLARNEKIIQTYIGFPDEEKMKTEIENLKTQLDKQYPISESPVITTFPHQLGKTNLLECPTGIAIDEENGRIFVSDFCTNHILILSLHGEILEIIGSKRAGNDVGKISNTTFRGPRGLAFDPKNQKLYVADSGNNCIKIIDFNSEESIIPDIDSITYPTRLFVDQENLFITTPNEIVKWNLHTEVSERITSQTLYQPMGIAVTPQGEIVFSENEISCISTLMQDEIKRSNPKFEKGGYADGKNSPRFNHPRGIVYNQGKIIVVDSYNHAIRQVHLNNYKTTTLAGDNERGFKDSGKKKARFNLPTDIAVLYNIAYITDTGNGVIRKLNLETGNTATLQLTDYIKLSHKYQPPIYDFRTADTLYVNKGKNEVEIRFDLSAPYELDPHGFSYTYINSRNKTLKVKENMVVHRIPYFEIDIEENDVSVWADFYVFFYDKEFPRRIYKQSFTLEIPIQLSSQIKETRHTVAFEFNPEPNSSF